MGMVDDKNHMNFYWGKCRVMDQQGKEVAKFAAENYLEYIGEQVLPWSYLKFPYLKKVGWNGITDGPKSGMVRVAPLSRINVSDGMATPLANAEWDRFMKTLGGRPVQFSLANHWARLIELLYAAERLQELMTDKDILDPNVRTMPKGNKKVGYGTIEAGRGTIVHHYECDDNGYVTKANMIVATAFNHGAICHETTKTAKAFIKNGQVSDGIFNLIEMVFRSYDPCFSCATHSLPGSMPMEIELKTRDGNIIQTLSNR
jgi:F420-non-reducing hydrogenase large subunit